MRKLIALLPLLLPAALAAAEDRGEYLLITPRPWADELKPLVALRTADGFRVSVVTTDTLAGADGEVSDGRLHALLEKRRPAACVLVGDVPQNMPDELRKLAVPTRYVLPGVYGGAGSEPVASDTAYGVFRSATAPADDEPGHAPAVPVGRLSARTVEVLRTILGKIVAAQGTLSFGTWRRRVNLIGGSPSYGPLVDRIIETLAGRTVDSAIAPRFDVTMTYANVNSVYCWPPPAFADQVVRRYDEGCLIYGYVGHGSATSVASLYDPVRGKSFDVLDTKIARRFRGPAGTATICALVTCSTGRFDGPAESLAETLAAAPGGPAAVIASSRVSMPYGNALLGKQLLEALCVRQQPTVGAALMDAFRTMLAPADPKDQLRAELDAAAAMMREDLAGPAERIKHVYLYTLFGDPATPIPYPPMRAEVAATGELRPGGTLAVTAATPRPMAGVARITIEIPRAMLAFEPAERQSDPDKLDACFQSNYARAEDKVLAAVTTTMAAGKLAADVPLPAESPLWQVTGRFYVKVYIAGDATGAFGAAAIERPPPSP